MRQAEGIWFFKIEISIYFMNYPGNEEQDKIYKKMVQIKKVMNSNYSPLEGLSHRYFMNLSLLA
jgi:hypothetical protein